MDGQLGVTSAHGTFGDVRADPPTQVAVELAVDERVDEAPVPVVGESQHAGGNPWHSRLLPAE